MISKPSPDQRLLQLLCSLPATEAVNILMRRSDRELAICLLYLDDEVSRILISKLGSAKRERVEVEKRYVSRMGVRYPEYRIHVEAIIAALAGKGGESIRSYIRPRRGEG